MKKILLPLICVLLSGAAGAGVATFLAKPDEKSEMDCKAEPCPDAKSEGYDKAPEKTEEAYEKEAGDTDFVKINKQFVVPLLENDKVTSLVLTAFSLEVKKETSEKVFEVEPKIQDAFLSVLFTHAHSGGFSGSFTSTAAMEDLRRRLKEEARAILGPILIDVLITEVVRQDM